ncbi:hypothetical protein P4114_26325 [Pseudomonas aeruginosa]|nr:hypothetical protein [Pseudomonas aeruginosa]
MLCSFPIDAATDDRAWQGLHRFAARRTASEKSRRDINVSTPPSSGRRTTGR